MKSKDGLCFIPIRISLCGD